MGMYDYVKCEYPLPDAPAEVQRDKFQTKAFGDGFTGGYMDSYTITKDGQLILHKTTWEVVPEEERPYYGKPEWNGSGLYQMVGSMKSIPLGDETIEHHGVINIYTIIADNKWFEYEIKFTDGKVSAVKRKYWDI